MLQELFFMPNTIEYASNSCYTLISSVGTLLLGLGVIALANARIQLQLAWAGAYLLLNIAHWTAAAMPREWNFSFRGYNVTEEFLSQGGQRANYLDTLCASIAFVGSSEWVRRSSSAPRGPAWDEWLDIAGHQAKRCAPSAPRSSTAKQSRVTTYQEHLWNARRGLDEIYGKSRRATESQVDGQGLSRAQPTHD